MKKGIVQWLFKAMAAGILALSISSLVCQIYFNPGIHTTNQSGATDYTWQRNSFVSTMREGIAWNRTDKNGFFNETEIDKNMDILVMGSSHMEGVNVFSRQKMPYLLSVLTGRSTYNIGISAHTLLVCTKNLEAALTAMEPKQYVVIETATTEFSSEAIQECLSGTMENLSSHDEGILFYLQKIGYFKLLYHNFLREWLDSWRENTGSTPAEESSSNSQQTPFRDAELFRDYLLLCEKIKKTCDLHGVQPIIFYHPGLELNSDGTVTANTEEVSLKILQTACQENGIIFVDMTDDFIKMYNTDCVMPNGFCNTSVGHGHLNQYGHRAIAEKLAKTIAENDANERDCKK